MLSGDATEQTPPDLPSYLFKERIVYLGMSLVPSGARNISRGSRARDHLSKQGLWHFAGSAAISLFVAYVNHLKICQRALPPSLHPACRRQHWVSSFHAVTELMMAELLYLQYDNPEKPVIVYINSTGVTRGGERLGYESEAFAIYDCMRFIKPKVHTCCVGCVRRHLSRDPAPPPSSAPIVLRLR